MQKNDHLYPVIYTYLKRYQEDPGSRVFAPLAEAYRKAGLIEEAIEISREGLRVHPTFIGGRVALARALFDKKLYAAVVDELAPVVRDVPDNLVAQRLLAESSLMLGRIADALSSYKMLLYFMPTDSETARMVLELEAQAYEQGALVLRKDPAQVPATPAATPAFNVKKASESISEDPGIVRAKAIRKVEFLQSMLLKVERLRH